MTECGWTVAPGFAVRVAGMPVSALAALRFETSFALAEELTDLSEWLAAEGAALSETLHGVIAHTADPALRVRLIGLRRALFQVRAPATGECAAAVMALLPPAARERVTAWLDRLPDPVYRDLQLEDKGEERTSLVRARRPRSREFHRRSSRRLQ